MVTRSRSLLVYFLSVGLGLTLGALSAHGDDEDLPDLSHIPELPRQAILRFAETDLEQWHYRRTMVSEDGVRVDRHDPTLPGPEHWQLVSIDGRTPSAEEREDYEDDRADHSEDDEKARPPDIADMITPGSVEDVTGEEGPPRYRCRLRSPDGKRERVFEALLCEMVVDEMEDGPWISEVTVWSHSPFRPFLGARIDEAELRFVFQEREGVVLPATVEVRWAGEFLRVKDIGRVMSFSLTNFRRSDLRRHAASPSP